MRVLLIRHAQVAIQDRIGLRGGLPLTSEGEAQAQTLAHRLSRREISAIFASPLKRTLQTAEILAAGRGIPVTPEPALIEVNPGEWDNRLLDELRADPVWTSFNRFRGGIRIPGGEMMLEVQCRAVSFLEKISHTCRGATVAVVSHADVIRAAVCHYAGIALDLSLHLEISPASLSILEIEDRGARLIRLNDTGD